MYRTLLVGLGIVLLVGSRPALAAVPGPMPTPMPIGTVSPASALDAGAGALLDRPTGIAGQTFNLYLPTVYNERTSEKFAALYISGPGGNPGFNGLEGWAEREEVVLVTINGSRNGPHRNNLQAQQAVLGTTMKQMRISKALRFSMGYSGAGWASANLAADHGDDWGGVLILINGRHQARIAKHVPIAWLAGRLDTTFPAAITEADYAAAKAEGHPVRITIFPDRGHQGMPQADVESMLSWMVMVSRLNHPKRSPAEVAAGATRVTARVAAIQGMTDDAEAQSACDELLGMDTVARGPHGNELRLAWARHGLHAGVAGEPIARYRSLERVSRSDRAKVLPEGERAALAADLVTLIQDPAVKQDVDSHEALAYARLLQTRAKTPKALQGVVALYNSIATRWPGTEAAIIASAEAEQITSGK